MEKGVAERVRLTQLYEKRRDDLQRQHDGVKSALEDHKGKVSGVNYHIYWLNYLSTITSLLKLQMALFVNHINAQQTN